MTKEENTVFDGARMRMNRRIERTVATISARFPNYADTATGEWTTSADGHWTGGHWVGQLWLQALESGNSAHLERAEEYCNLLAPRASSHTIFRGFLFYYGAALGQCLHGLDTAGDLAVQGARGLMRDFNSSAGIIPLGAEAEEASDVGDTQTNIDAVGAISSLLCWASARTGDSSFRAAALSHARRHVELCVRDDASVCQSASFDAQTGALQKRFSHKGYADDSTWARAQAWAMLAFALSAKNMPEEPLFLDTACRVADWWIARTAADKVAFWDFNDPAIPNVNRDTSSTAIAAASLLKLSDLVDGQGQGKAYSNHARETVLTLSNDYLTPVGEADQSPQGILTQGCYNKHLDLATNNELVWGDYYLYEALQVLNGCILSTDV